MEKVPNHKTPDCQENKTLYFDQIKKQFKQKISLYKANLAKRKIICLLGLFLIFFGLGIVFMSMRHILQLDKYLNVKELKSTQSVFKQTQLKDSLLFQINSQKRILLQNIPSNSSSQNLISICQITIQIATSIANILKILFQLTALLFIITDLINFWGLASIYIFLPIQIPIFAKNILQNAWTNFNLPILSYMRLSLPIPSLNSQKFSEFSYLDEKLWQHLKLQMFQMMFQPLIILTITAIELFLLNKILNWIKLKFRLMRKSIQEQHIKIDFKKLKNKQILLKMIKNHIKSKKDSNQFKFDKIQKLNRSEQTKQELQKKEKLQTQKKQKLQTQKKQQQQINLNLQTKQKIYEKQSIKEINSINLNNFLQQFSQKKILMNQNQEQQSHPKSINLSSILTHIIKKMSLKKKKHWSQSININKLQIFAALIISYMPQFFLPLYNSVLKDNAKTLLQKVNLLLYYALLFLLFTFPFIYIMINCWSKTNKSKPYQKVNLKSQKNHKISNQKISNNNQKISNNNQKISNNSQKISNNNHFKMQIKQFKIETIQTFFQFYLNITIPVLVSITSNPLPFLLINFVMLILYVFLDITLYKAKNLKANILKINNIIQKITFLCYHFLFLTLHIFNVFKQDFKQMNILSAQQVDMIFKYFGISIVFVFAFGGIHQLSQFLIRFIFNICKITYMIFRVCMGKYEFQKQEEQTTQLKLGKNGTKQNKCKQKILISQESNIVPQNSDNLTEIEQQFDIEILKNKILIEKLKMENKFSLLKNVQTYLQSPQSQFKIHPLQFVSQQFEAQFNSQHKIFNQTFRKQKIVNKKQKIANRKQNITNKKKKIPTVNLNVSKIHQISYNISENIYEKNQRSQKIGGNQNLLNSESKQRE